MGISVLGFGPPAPFEFPIPSRPSRTHVSPSPCAWLCLYVAVGRFFSFNTQYDVESMQCCYVMLSPFWASLLILLHHIISTLASTNAVQSLDASLACQDVCLCRQYCLVTLEPYKLLMNSKTVTRFWCFCDHCLHTNGGLPLGDVPVLAEKTCKNHYYDEERNPTGAFYSHAKLSWIRAPSGGMDGTYPAMPDSENTFVGNRDAYMEFIKRVKLCIKRETTLPPLAAEAGTSSQHPDSEQETGQDQPSIPVGDGHEPGSSAVRAEDLDDNAVEHDIVPCPSFLDDLWGVEESDVDNDLISKLPGKDGAAMRLRVDRRPFTMHEDVDSQDLFLLFMNLVLVRATCPG